MTRREPMAPVEGLKKPTLPPPTSRPATLKAVPPVEEDVTLSPREASSGAAVVVSKPPRPRVARSSTVASRPRSADADLVKAVSVSVPLPLAEAWRDRAKRDGVSQVDVLLDAFVAHRDELDRLVAETLHKPTVSDGLFDRRPSSPTVRSVGISLRIKASNLEVIDQLAEQHGASKRSPFIVAVLTAYLAL